MLKTCRAAAEAQVGSPQNDEYGTADLGTGLKSALNNKILTKHVSFSRSDIITSSALKEI